MRGEYPATGGSPATGGELPPRARRIPSSRTHTHAILGTTSACAENTLCVIDIRISLGNYLRVRGEYGPGVPCTGDQGELPPRARRIRLGVSWPPHQLGTTSACAENTNHHPKAGGLPRNYLRVRGEYNPLHSLKGKSMELPPRARRILTALIPCPPSGGTTSACAENTATGATLSRI